MPDTVSFPRAAARLAPDLEAIEATFAAAFRSVLPSVRAALAVAEELPAVVVRSLAAAGVEAGSLNATAAALDLYRLPDQAAVVPLVSGRTCPACCRH